MNTVTILMSTYNGEKYLEAQLDSIINQKNVNVNIIVRDDGSSDKTASILNSYSMKYPNITVISGINLGVEKSFHALCLYANESAKTDYYAFCDQDDIWDKNKLVEAIKLLEQYPIDKPNLYFSNLYMVDTNLNPMRILFEDNEVFTAKEKAFVQFFAYGCTCVFNKKAMEMYNRITDNNSLHDIWIYVVCLFIGNVVYDNRSFIKYRQHQNNFSGKKVKGGKLFIQRIKRFLRGNLGHMYEITARQLIESYDNYITDEDKPIIQRVANYRNCLRSKMSLLFDKNFATSSLQKNLCIKFRILSNHL